MDLCWLYDYIFKYKILFIFFGLKGYIKGIGVKLLVFLDDNKFEFLK